jgi:hypothetical protein
MWIYTMLKLQKRLEKKKNNLLKYVPQKKPNVFRNAILEFFGAKNPFKKDNVQ